jgi:hypothetical protein
MLNNYKQNYRKNENLRNWRKTPKTDQFNNNARNTWSQHSHRQRNHYPIYADSDNYFRYLLKNERSPRITTNNYAQSFLYRNDQKFYPPLQQHVVNYGNKSDRQH